MKEAVERYPGQIRDLEAYIEALEKQVEQLRERVQYLETQTFGGSTK